MTKDIQELEDIARLIRSRVIKTSHLSGIPHLGSCLSCVDILVALYFSELKIYPEDPHNDFRDRFILSKGHAAPALFQVLGLRGFFNERLLDDYGLDGGVFAEHPPTPSHLAGIEAATGSLGHGLPMALGMAFAAKLKTQDLRVFSVVGDGECNEGSIWEAAMLAAAHKLNNLCIFIDFNKWQATGRSCEIMSLDPMVDKWRAFGWEAMEINGNVMSEVLASIECFKANKARKPFAIISHTIKGYGVDFMQDDNNWHYKIPSEKDVIEANKQLGFF